MPSDPVERSGWTHRLDSAARLAVVRFGSEVDTAVLVDSVEQLAREPGWHPDFDVIWDCRRVRRMVLPPEDLGRVVGVRVEHIEGRQVSVVARELDEITALLISSLLQRANRSLAVAYSFEEAATLLGRGTLPPGFEG